MQTTVSIPCAWRHNTLFSSLCPPQLKSHRQLVRGKDRRGHSLLSRQRRETRKLPFILCSQDDSTPAGLPSFAARSSSFPQGRESSDSLVSASCFPALLSSSSTSPVSQRLPRCLPPPVSPAATPRSGAQSSSLYFVFSVKRRICFQRLLAHSSRTAPGYRTPGPLFLHDLTQPKFSLSRCLSSFSLAPTQRIALHSRRIRPSAQPAFSLVPSSSPAPCSASSSPPPSSAPFSYPLFSPSARHPWFSASFSSSPSPPSASRSRKVHLIDDPGDCDAILDELFFAPSSSALLLPPSPLTTHLMVHRQMSSSSLSSSSFSSSSFSSSSSASPSTSSPFLSGDFSRQLVALDCEGVTLGRFGRVCTVQLATPTHTLLLDALKPGVVGGNRKLKDVLESPHIVKVRFGRP
uniref:3'-5' exonuclease domain protein n=1 Tax=Toxoplasma gondii COUG TaxID=1074873 RepID=A0A2G8YAN6_TOXGO|nr:3'-5' exonuclease domain protein [Toxoplasma gondii COUG]